MQNTAWVAAAAWVSLTLGACSENKDRAEDAAEAARDVAMVERMNETPFRAITPAPITTQDVARFGLGERGGCLFRPGLDDRADPLLVTQSDEAILKIADQLARMAAKRSSATLPGGAYTAYVGLYSWIDLMRLPDEGTGGDDYRFPARLILHDAQGRIAFQSNGSVLCSPDEPLKMHLATPKDT
jgi:hypothetical protein